MKSRILAAFALCAMAASAYGCATECDCADLMMPDTAMDAQDTVTPEDVAPDIGRDVVPQDIALDSNPTDSTPEDVPADLPIDANPDVESDSTTPDECQTEYDCDNCDICTEIDGVRKCMATPEAGMKECYATDDCTEGAVCHFDVVGKPECGGYCGPDAAYSLHEWGVNVVTIAGGASLSTGPKRFYGAVVAKPVIYIYSDEQFTLDVGVTYKAGVAYETWPEIPLSDDVVWEGIQVGTTECTTTPTPEPDMSGMAEPESLEIYDLPEWVVADANCLTFGETVSKVLFYTGPFVGYQPPVDATLNLYSEQNDGSVTIENSLTTAIGPVLMVYRDTESECVDPSYCPVHTARIAYAVIPEVPATSSAAYDVTYVELHKDATEEDPYPSVESLLPVEWTSLPGVMKEILEDKGLTTPEAGVFMTAWTEIMFGLMGQDASWYYPSYRNGASLIYLWPDSVTEEMVPMNAVPAPTEKVRALVEYQEIDTVLNI